MKLKFLGTGTSQGIPVIGSTHPVCLSTNPKDKRLRSSVMITDDEGKKILIDCGPDFRQQMLTNQESNVDALLITHEHNDHIIGLDDLRPIIFQKRKDISIYCLPRVGKEIQNRFPYAFTEDKYPGAPSFEITEIGNEPFIIENTEIKEFNTNVEEEIIRVNLIQVTDNARYFLCGNNQELGNWDIEEAKELTLQGNMLSYLFNSDNWENIEYKLFKKYQDGSIVWENGNNRIIDNKENYIAWR